MKKIVLFLLGFVIVCSILFNIFTPYFWRFRGGDGFGFALGSFYIWIPSWLLVVILIIIFFLILKSNFSKRKK